MTRLFIEQPRLHRVCKIYCIDMVLRILEGHQNCMISLLRIMGESTREGLWLLALVTGERWHVTGYMWHVTCDLWHVAYDFFFSLIFYLQKTSSNKELKSAQKGRNISNRRDLLVSVLLSAHTMRVSKSRMQDFYYYFIVWLQNL